LHIKDSFVVQEKTFFLHIKDSFVLQEKSHFIGVCIFWRGMNDELSLLFLYW
jgi:hypothetical protein